MKLITTIAILLLFISTIIYAQEKVYVYKNGAIINEYEITEVDSIIFYKPTKETTISDYDGNVYHTIVIGNQTWMGENLRTTKFNDGISINEITDNALWSNATSSAYCWINNDKTYKNPYGALYNWYSVSTGKLCPSGWHVPSNSDWNILRTFINNDGFSENGTVLKSKYDWISNDGTDYYGFNGLPAGERRQSDGSFVEKGEYGFWWSIDISSSNYYWMYYLTNDSNMGKYLVNMTAEKRSGLSVRCIKD